MLGNLRDIVIMSIYRSFDMILLEYYKSLSAREKRELAKKVGTTVPYLCHMAHGTRRPGPDMARKLEKASRRVVTKKELRPDIWG